MTPLKVLIPVDHAVGISGPHRNVVGTLNALGRRDDVQVVLFTGMIDASEYYASAPNVDVHLGFQPHNPKRILANLWQIQRAAHGCDVIYVPSGLKAFLYAQSVRRRKRLVAGPNVTPLPIRTRGDSPGKLELTYLSDAWFEMSRSRRDHVRRQTGIQSISYIHHAIDLEKFSPHHKCRHIWAEIGVPQDSVIVIYVGRDNEPRKGVSQLLDAADVLGEMESNTHFVLVGEMSSRTRERAAGLTNTTLIGFQMGDRLPKLYASADIAVIPSSWESFGFTILESMACGLPVISTNSGAIPELIEQGKSGVLLDLIDGRTRYKPEAGQMIAEAVLHLARNPEQRREIGLNARERAERHFSEDRLGRDLMAIFRNEPGPNSA